MVPMIRALALTIALSHKVIYHPPTSKLRLLRLLVLHLTQIQRGGKFWTFRGAAASVIKNVSISAPNFFGVLTRTAAQTLGRLGHQNTTYKDILQMIHPTVD
jgi:hypothetical protein